jgi:hypothetical protein
LEPGAAVDAAAELVLGAAAGLLAAGGVRPMSRSSAVNALLNRFCADVTGTWAAVLLVESVEVSSRSEPFL